MSIHHDPAAMALAEGGQPRVLAGFRVQQDPEPEITEADLEAAEREQAYLATFGPDAQEIAAQDALDAQEQARDEAHQRRLWSER